METRLKDLEKCYIDCFTHYKELYDNGKGEIYKQMYLDYYNCWFKLARILQNTDFPVISKDCEYKPNYDKIEGFGCD